MKKEQKKGFGIVGIIIVMAAVVVLGGWYFVYQNYSENQACSKDLKICPDGSHVGRIPPMCEFPECPASSQTSEIDTSNWKTYRNEQYGFEVRYPKSISVSFNEGPMIGSWVISIHDPIVAKGVTGVVPAFDLTNRYYPDGARMARTFGEVDIDTLRMEAVIYFQEQGYTLSASCRKFHDFKAGLIEGLSLCNQILSTFKFIPSTSSWQAN